MLSCFSHYFYSLHGRKPLDILFVLHIHLLSFSGVRRVASYSSLVSCWMLMNFGLLNAVMKAWILVSNMGYIDWGLCWLVMQEDHGLRIGVGGGALLGSGLN